MIEFKIALETGTTEALVGVVENLSTQLFVNLENTYSVIMHCTKPTIDRFDWIAKKWINVLSDTYRTLAYDDILAFPCHIANRITEINGKDWMWIPEDAINFAAQMREKDTRTQKNFSIIALYFFAKQEPTLVRNAGFNPDEFVKTFV
jgi:hypothetical protein